MPKKNYPYPPVKYSILLLTYNRVDLIEARIEDMRWLYSDRPDVEVRILDNGGSDGTTLFLVAEKRAWLNDSVSQLHTNRTTKNIGFGPGFNKLAEDALGDILFFVSDDVKISGDFTTPVSEMIRENPNVLCCHEKISGAAGWNQFGGKAIDYPAGHFLACTKEIWMTLGGFDKRYIPNDYEDVDIGMTALDKGIEILEVPGLLLSHAGAETLGYTPERYENTVLQRKRFAEKWNLPNVPERP